MRKDHRKMTGLTQCEFILCNSYCSRFLPEKSLHSPGGDRHEREQQHNKVLVDDCRGHEGNRLL